MKKFRILFFILVIFILTLPLWFARIHLPFRENAATKIWELILGFLVISLLIERALEVLLTTTRARRAKEMDERISKLRERVVESKGGAGYEGAQREYDSMREERKQFRFDTLSLSLWLGLLLGLIVSALGVRALETILETKYLECVHVVHKRLFHVVDVLLTGGLLAGGSDGIHKLAEAYRGIMEGQKQQEEDKPVGPLKTQ
jgi:hypothetical protein